MPQNPLLSPIKHIISVASPIAHRISVYEWPNITATQTIVCVHGLTRNSGDFTYLAQNLSMDYRVICIDIPGRGESEWLSDPSHYGYPLYVADCKYILDSLQLQQVDWIGTSMGGIIAMMLINQTPGLIRSLILNDIGCFIPANALQRIKTYTDTSTVFTTRAQAEDALRMRCATFGIHEEAHWQHLFDYSIQPHHGQFRLAYDPAIINALPALEAIKDVDLWALWPALSSVPVLLLRGAESDLLQADTAMRMKTTHSNLTYQEIAGAGHAPELMSAAHIQLTREWINNNY